MAKYTQKEIDALGAKGQAFHNPDGHYSYPVADEEDLHNAIHAVGRGGASHDAIRRYIIRRAKALGLSSAIPDNWTAGGGSSSLHRPDLQRLASHRGRMLGVREQRAVPFVEGVELRAKPDGTGGSSYAFRGYAATFADWFPMWDKWGDPYEESLRQGAFTQTLAGEWGGPDVRFLIGHNDGDLALARTAHGPWPGTMRLGQDTRGLEVDAPALDGRSSRVRDLASAVERGDMDGMSIGYVAQGQEWTPDWAKRTLTALDLHNGDVSVVAIPANPAAAGSVMIPLAAAGGMRQARPAEVRSADDADAEIMDVASAPDYNPDHGAGALQCASPDCSVPGGAMNAADARWCDQCGAPLYDEDGLIVLDDSGVVEEVGGAMADADLLAMQRRLRLLEIA
jgi:HK97 family phage prohead protease